MGEWLLQKKTKKLHILSRIEISRALNNHKPLNIYNLNGFTIVSITKFYSQYQIINQEKFFLLIYHHLLIIKKLDMYLRDKRKLTN